MMMMGIRSRGRMRKRGVDGLRMRGGGIPRGSVALMRRWDIRALRVGMVHGRGRRIMRVMWGVRRIARRRGVILGVGVSMLWRGLVGIHVGARVGRVLLERVRVLRWGGWHVKRRWLRGVRVRRVVVAAKRRRRIRAVGHIALREVPAYFSVQPRSLTLAPSTLLLSTLWYCSSPHPPTPSHAHAAAHILHWQSAFDWRMRTQITSRIQHIPATHNFNFSFF